jgi:hypothetical protein
MMTQKEQRTTPDATHEQARIRGRLRGLETVWSLPRFTEVIEGDVSKGLQREWSPERIRSWIASTYDVDQRSAPHAARAVDRVLGTLARKPHRATRR